MEVRGEKTITVLCIDCNVGNQHTILEVVREPKEGASGLYRTECTTCGFKQTIQSKTPSQVTGIPKVKPYPFVDGDKEE